MPVLFGALLAPTLTDALLNWKRLLLSLTAMVLLQAAFNILNDVSDFNRGLDREPKPVSGAVVRRLLTPRQALRGAAVLFALGILLGLYLARESTWWLLPVGVSGVVLGLFYTPGGAFALKYLGLGDLAVFTAFGLLGSLGAWMVQSGSAAWPPVIFAIPQSLLVAAILHANNWRDMQTDIQGSIRTPALFMGDRGSSIYLHLLVISPFILVPSFVFIPGWCFPRISALPSTCLLTLAALPAALRLLTHARRRHSAAGSEVFQALDGATARLNLIFGLLLNTGLFVHLLIRD
ncbi:MAG: prenyltransferase [Acidobacteriota bacterium]|nr:prenyltransferase [Acidobacteriota bacterium]